MSDKRYIAWARVSSARQKDEGWSLDQQEERLREYATRTGGEIVKTYVVTETASKHAERKTFREMLDYARANAKRIDGLLVMKIDRAARNMRDFVALETLEEECGIKLVSVTQPTEHTPAGRMMRRTFATFASYFTDQLSADVKQSMRRRAEAGLFVTLAPYGYRNVRDAGGRRIVAVDPIEAEAVRRIFHLYAYENHTLDSLRTALIAGGVDYKASQPQWVRSKLYELLIDRSYIGEVDHLGQWYPGTHTPLIDRPTFDRVQALLGRRAYRCHSMLYAGSLVTCGHCGRPITGEAKTKRTRAGERTYTYYRCSRYNAAGHPRVRLAESQLDAQVLAEFDRLRVCDDELRDWIAATTRADVRQGQEAARARRDRAAVELTRLRNQKDQLLNLRLLDEIDADTYARKAQELRDREAGLQLDAEAAGRGQDEQAELIVKAFELSQSLREKWATSDVDAKRRILELVCLNCRLDGTTLVLLMRKPFAVLAEGLIVAKSAQDRI